MMASGGLAWPGMSTCYTYFGRAHACFAAHAEDHNLPSVNQLVWGAPKLWWALPPRDFLAGAAALRAAVPRGELPACAQAVAHKLLLPSLALVALAVLEGVHHLDRDLVLHDLFNHDLQLGAAIPRHQRPSAFHQLHPATLNERAELEAAANLEDNVITLESLNHRALHPVRQCRCPA
jgi:hypothetical protein